MNNQKIIEIIKKEKIPVIIFGAGVVGEALFYACLDAGIKVDCFCDNNINKTKFFLCNLGIIHTSDLKKKFDNAIFLISAADINDVVGQLNNLGYSNWRDSSFLLRDFNIYEQKFSAPMDFVEYAVSSCLLCHDSYSAPHKLFLRSADIIITERCSLKCKNCSNLMPYYKNPRNCDLKELLESIENFCLIIDEINEFRVIGGEPFMNREFDVIIKKLANEPKVKKIIIYTNGTIVPPDDKIGSLKNKKTFVIITDYGGLSRNIDILCKKLSDNDIAFYRQKPYGWTDCAKIERHFREPEAQKAIFGNCCAKNLVTISGDSLYRCPFSANANRLKAIPDYKKDYINFSGELTAGASIPEMKNKIKDFLLNKETLEACDFCNGRSFGDPEITPAEQLSNPLEYKQYE